MAADTRVYIVDDKLLVRASSAAQALRLAVHGQHSVRVASQDDILKVAGLNIEVHYGGAESDGVEE